MAIITVSQPGAGRWGNQVFGYMFGRTYARRHGLTLHAGPWAGNDLIGASDPPIAAKLPDVLERPEHRARGAVIPHARTPIGGVNFVGYFQYHTSFYAPDRDYIRALFRPRPEVEARIAPGVERLREGGRTLVAIHVRRGDYGMCFFYRTPVQWYLDQLERIWPTLERPRLYVASDDLPGVLDRFARYEPATASDLGAPLPSSDFYRDFYVLQRCDVALIPNSTFSFSACMLNPRLRASYRSVIPARGFVPFDPWDDEPLQQGRDAHVERYPHIPELWKPQPAWKRYAKWVRHHLRA